MYTRHADKGAWKVNEQELRNALPADEAELILSVLKNEFSDMKEIIPLKLDGLERSLRLGDSVYEDLPPRSVLIALDSGKDRAELTRALAVARIAQQEKQQRGENKKRVDILSTGAKELTSLLADSDPSTWGPYAQMMQDEGISEEEAIVRWLKDMNKIESGVDPVKHPKESVERYQKLLQILQASVTSKQVPVVILGIGHSGPLGQMKYEKQGKEISSQETPKFCEMFTLNKEGELVSTKQVGI